jgi:predicted nucleotidyltransferase component of viral defense system
MQSPYEPVLAEEDVIGTKVRTLADRGAPRDLIDVYVASRRWTNVELVARVNGGTSGGRFFLIDHHKVR